MRRQPQIHEAAAALPCRLDRQGTAVKCRAYRDRLPHSREALMFAWPHKEVALETAQPRGIGRAGALYCYAALGDDTCKHDTWNPNAT